MKKAQPGASRIKLFLAALFLFLPALASHSQTTPAPLPPSQQVPRSRVIVFVHGLHGSRDTWRSANGAYWPDLLRNDPRFAYSDVEVAEYPTPSSHGKMSSTQLADVLYTRLNQDHVWDHREVVFLAHSLGGILVEEMLLRHPNVAAQVKFIVSYGTPHEGSTVARVASLYDKDPLLVDLSDASDNTFLTQLENNWRGNDSVNGIHRFCAYEALDTKPDNYFGRYLKTHARVVSYFSATYGCDVTTPPQEIHADHLNMVKPADRKAAAYDFFYRVYRNNPVREPRTATRYNIIPDLKADCDQTNANPDLPVAIALDPALQEKVSTATATLIDAKDIRAINPNPPVVTAIDPTGVAHVHYSFNGPSKKLFACLATGHASLRVDFFITQQVPIREPGN